MTSEGDAKFTLAIAQKELVGGTIVGTLSDPGSEQFSYGLIVQNNGKTYNCWIDCDPEGNGAGFLSINEEIKDENDTASR